MAKNLFASPIELYHGTSFGSAAPEKGCADCELAKVFGTTQSQNPRQASPPATSPNPRNRPIPNPQISRSLRQKTGNQYRRPTGRPQHGDVVVGASPPPPVLSPARQPLYTPARDFLSPVLLSIIQRVIWSREAGDRESPVTIFCIVFSIASGMVVSRGSPGVA